MQWSLFGFLFGSIVIVASTGCGRVAFDALDDDGGAGSVGARARRTLRLDRVDPGEQLTGFPLLVALDDTRIDRGILADDASDLRFFDASGTLIPHEIEQLSPTLLVWVRVPSINALTTTIDMTYGGSSLAPSTDPVWDSRFGGVWHLDETGDANDVSSNRFVARSTNAPGVPGVIGNARTFNGVDSFLVVPGATAQSFAPTEFTLSAWIRPTTVEMFEGALTRQFGGTSGNDLYLGVSNGNAMAASAISTGEISAIGGSVTLNTWTYVAGTATASTVAVFVDGVQSASSPISEPLATSANTNAIFLGADCSAACPIDTPSIDFFVGAIDEVRMESIARSPSWLAYTYAATRDLVISY